MAVHVPLSAEAQAEARFLMLSANNLLKPQDGKPVTVPTQDMVLGTYYLTMEKEAEKDKDGNVINGVTGEGKVFSSPEEALMAYHNGNVSLHARIKVRRTIEVNGVRKSKVINTTVGKIIFNSAVPQNLGFVDRTNLETMFDYEVDFVTGKKELAKIIDRCIKINGTNKTAVVLDKIKALGFEYSTRVP